MSLLPSALHPHNKLLSETQTVTSSETTYGGGVVLMHCESMLLQARCLLYCLQESRRCSMTGSTVMEINKVNKTMQALKGAEVEFFFFLTCTDTLDPM